MAAIRARERISQINAAAMLGVGERSYKLYETEARELPLAVAMRICERFDVDLKWLVYGDHANADPNTLALIKDAFDEVVDEANRRGKKLTRGMAGEIGKFVCEQCLKNRTIPNQEVGRVFDLIGGSEVNEQR
jgi:DNA-binding XRE family transcriptional regulator